MTKKTLDTSTATTVLITKDLDRFKSMDGNRSVNQQHVKQLQRLMLTNGNLTHEFPIVIDSEGYVVDGQHRLEALRGLGWEIAYRVQENATIDTVRAINQGNRNWSWRDIAYSYASRGDATYTWFLTFVDQYGLKFDAALSIVTGKVSGGNGSGRKMFFGGELQILDKARAYDTARQIVEVQRLVQIASNDFSKALVVVMRSPAYDHERMMSKLRQQGELLPEKAKVSDYMRRLEEMYNFGFAEGNRVRLF